MTNNFENNSLYNPTPEEIKKEEDMMTEEQKESPEKPTPVTPEMIIANKDFVEKIITALSTKKISYHRKRDSSGQIIWGYEEREYIDYEQEISFGPQFEKTDLLTILFYLKYYTGLENGSNGFSLVEEYLRLLQNDPNKAQIFLQKHQDTDKAGQPDSETEDYLRRGFLLSSVIPGAPDLVTEQFTPQKGEVAPDFFGRSTSKVEDILGSKEEIDKLRDVVAGKIVIDLGAGEGYGVRVAMELGARSYVAVEPMNAIALLDTLKSEVRRNKKEPGQLPEKMHIAKTDMKTFLSKLPDDVEDAVFLISGIDGYILGFYDLGPAFDEAGEEEARKKREAGLKYRQDVQDDLSRVIAPGQSAIIYASNFGLSNDKNFDRSTIPSFESSIDIYTKKTVDLK